MIWLVPLTSLGMVLFCAALACVALVMGYLRVRPRMLSAVAQGKDVVDGVVGHIHQLAAYAAAPFVSDEDFKRVEAVDNLAVRIALTSDRKQVAGSTSRGLFPIAARFQSLLTVLCVIAASSFGLLLALFDLGLNSAVIAESTSLAGGFGFMASEAGLSVALTVLLIDFLLIAFAPFCSSRSDFFFPSRFVDGTAVVAVDPALPRGLFSAALPAWFSSDGHSSSLLNYERGC